MDGYRTFIRIAEVNASGGVATTMQLAGMLNMSRQTVWRDTSALLRAGRIMSIGHGEFCINPDAPEIEKIVEAREAVRKAMK